MRLFRNPFRKPTLIVTTVQINQNCFCGAAFSISVPVIYKPDTSGTEYLIDVDALREQWHESHFHQLNPQLGQLMDVTESTEAVAVGPREFGFQLPHG